MTYAHTRHFPGAAFDDMLARARQALAAQGFGIPVEMDTQAIFKAKLGKDSERRVILGACLPQVAFEAMQQEPELAVLLPCNVVVRELPAGIEVTAVAPKALFTLARKVEAAHAEEVEARLLKALDALG